MTIQELTPSQTPSPCTPGISVEKGDQADGSRTNETDRQSRWEDRASAKRRALWSSLPSEWLIPPHLLPPSSQDDVTGFPESSGWFTAEELAITNSSALSLLSGLASGELRSETVTRAFCKRAAAAHQLTNCLSETCFSRALSRARELDAHLARTGIPIGPLHGLPISLKDNFNLRGLDSTVGFISHTNHPSPSNAVLADILHSLGAVFYVKTNVPTAMMIAETVNNLFGRTVSPLNRRLTSGGSSGGESALLAFKGSPLGVGTDIGGSLRIPAACTGTFTLRPSFGRFPTLGCRSGMPGQEAVQSVNGPLARNLEDLHYYCKSVVDAEPWLWDPRCLPISWRKVRLPESLRIGVLYDDGMATPTPPVKRALATTVAKLRAAGHEIVDWASEDQTEGAELLQRMFVADGGKAIRCEVEATGEPWRPELRSYEEARELSASEYWQLHLERTAFQKRYLDRWNAAGLDAILCPTTPYSSVENGKFRHVGYTGVFNVLDYSCVSFPSEVLVDASIDLNGQGLEEEQDGCHRHMTQLDREIQRDYNPEAVHGMPVNLQLVGRRLEEEKVIEMVKVVLDATSCTLN